MVVSKKNAYIKDLNALRILMNFLCIYLGEKGGGCALMHVQWNLSKPIPIRTKENYRFRQVIGLDRLTFTALDKISYKKLKCLHPTKHKLYK